MAKTKDESCRHDWAYIQMYVDSVRNGKLVRCCKTCGIVQGVNLKWKELKF